MRKSIKTILSTGLVAAMALTMVACGSQGGSNTSSATKPADSSKPAASSEAAKPAGGAEGDVLNIEVWNDEFMTRVVEKYPGYKKTGDTTGEIDGVKVNWNVTANQDNAYQKNLDAKLKKNADATSADKVDIFLVEADYALKYVNAATEVTSKLSDLGIDAKKDLADQYKYTQDVVTDAKGDLRGASWQICPAGLIYNREIAKAVLGSDDPAEVQKAVADWNTYYETSKKMAAAGYLMQATAMDTYRVYSNNVKSPWVKDGKINIDDAIKTWVEKSKAQVDGKECSTDELWGTNEWTQGFYPADNTTQIGKGVFCYFGPAWFFNFSMKADDAKSIAAKGGWGLTAGPQGHYWGGTWICATKDTDNKELVAKLIKTMTADEAVLKDIAVTYSEAVNNKKIIGSLKTDDAGKVAILGGQNPYEAFDTAAAAISLDTLSNYDQGCNEKFQAAMNEYFKGSMSYDDAMTKFQSDVKTLYPDLK